MCFCCCYAKYSWLPSSQTENIYKMMAKDKVRKRVAELKQKEKPAESMLYWWTCNAAQYAQNKSRCKIPNIAFSRGVDSSLTQSEMLKECKSHAKCPNWKVTQYFDAHLQQNHTAHSASHHASFITKCLPDVIWMCASLACCSCCISWVCAKQAGTVI